MAKRPTMQGYELVAKVAALEGFVMVLLEAHLDNPDLTANQAQALLDKMSATALDLAKDMDHPEFQAALEKYVGEIKRRLSDALPRLRDGAPG